MKQHIQTVNSVSPLWGDEKDMIDLYQAIVEEV